MAFMQYIQLRPLISLFVGNHWIVLCIDQYGRYGGQWDGQHEVHAQRRPHHRHPGRRQRRGQLWHTRQKCHYRRKVGDEQGE